MAKNRVFTAGQYLSLVCTAPTTPLSGDPVLIGQIPAVATSAERADGTTPVDLGPAVYTLPVTSVSTAIAVGDRLYAVTGSPVVINNVNTGVPFGFALGAVANGQTANINVKIQRFGP